MLTLEQTRRSGSSQGNNTFLDGRNLMMALVIVCCRAVLPRPSRLTKSLGTYAITHKTVSRKHIVIEVSPLEPGQGVGEEVSEQINFMLTLFQSEIYAKSKVTITDGSKLGTYLDGVFFKKESKVVTGHDHAFTLGSYNQHFRYA